MRASKRSRNRRGVSLPSNFAGEESRAGPVMPDGLKIDIAHVVRTFLFTGVDAWTCLARAAIGHAVLHACGLPARLIPGGAVGWRLPADCSATLSGRLASIGMAGWFASESLAGMDRNYRPLCSGILEGSTRFPRLSASGGKLRDVVEAGLNEAAVSPRGLWALSATGRRTTRDSDVEAVIGKSQGVGRDRSCRPGA